MPRGSVIRRAGGVRTRPPHQGLGTPGVHTCLDREAQGRAVLDSVRAARRLTAAHLPDSGPVALYGYSQGGAAAASAAELARTYAPELNVRGAVVGAPPRTWTRWPTASTAPRMRRSSPMPSPGSAPRTASTSTRT
ncbi:lipase family protein [Streptomyces sp. NPDC056161]|uniref:lipase family protein n=1 Tax=Streptomyces sp. NPDC056161 TaxID=3345732 RepID=UPI0035DBD2E4